MADPLPLPPPPPPPPPPPSPPPLSDRAGRVKEGKRKGRAHWDDEKRAYLVKLLSDYNTPDYRAQKGWTKAAWSKIKNQINLRYSTPNLTMLQIKDQEQHLKKIYKSLKKLSESKGFAWDYEKNMVVASPDIWQPILESDNKAKKWHDRSFPYYSDLQVLYSGEYAEGRHSEGENLKTFPIQEPTDEIVPPPTVTPTILALEEAEHVTKEVDDTGGSLADPLPAQGPPQGDQPQSSASTRQVRSKLLFDNGQARKKRIRKDAFKGDYIAMRERETYKYMEAIEKKARLKAELQISVMETQRKHHEEAWERERQREYMYSTERCIDVYRSLEGFSVEDSVKAFHFFRDQYSREFFLSMSEEERAPWLRTMFDKV